MMISLLRVMKQHVYLPIMHRYLKKENYVYCCQNMLNALSLGFIIPSSSKCYIAYCDPIELLLFLQKKIYWKLLDKITDKTNCESCCAGVFLDFSAPNFWTLCSSLCFFNRFIFVSFLFCARSHNFEDLKSRYHVSNIVCTLH